MGSITKKIAKGILKADDLIKLSYKNSNNLYREMFTDHNLVYSVKYDNCDAARIDKTSKKLKNHLHQHSLDIRNKKENTGLSEPYI